ncbi:ribosome maturation factor RimM [Holospora obtusa F1]|uniref:Ribosome maturation factor RimM n=1 Tax=Holospora obtusa F1 TaxID=1399147 RepID=W6TEM3_HOLOB|nr:ribosome maturation factor RimM [Holospora obtusa]ETZ07788.1 ribosome maturation factor RimM [Holospora obtusa F1]
MILLAKIICPKGVKGRLKIEVFTEDPYFITKCPLVVNEKKEHLKFIFCGWIKKPSQIEAQCQGIDSRDKAEFLRGMNLYTFFEHFPSLPYDCYYWKELEGCALQYGEIGLGTVIRVNNFGATDLLEISSSKSSSSFFIPFHKNFIKDVCKIRKIISCTQEVEELINMIL